MRTLCFLILFFCTTLYLPAQELFSFKKNDKYGFKDAAGNMVVKPVYESASYSFTSLGGVSKDGKWAVINNRGQLLTDFVYSGGVGDAKGFDLIPVYNASGFMGVNHFFGLVNKAGVEIAPPDYVFVEIVSNELAIVSSSGFYGILNAAGQYVLPMEYSKEALKVFTNIQPSGAYYKDGQWKAFSYNGATIKKWKYDDIVIEGEHLWPIKYHNKWGYADTLGRELVSTIYDSVGIFSGGIAWVSIGGKKGVMNNKGTLVIPAMYDGIVLDKTGNYYLSANGKWGLANKEGSAILPVKYDVIGQVSEELYPVKLDGKWGFADAAAKEVIALLYDGVLPFSDGVAAVVLHNKVGFINKAGVIIIEPQFDDVVESFYKGKAIVVKDQKEIYIDKNGKEIK
jgi:hypothetical protein